MLQACTQKLCHLHVRKPPTMGLQPGGGCTTGEDCSTSTRSSSATGALRWALSVQQPLVTVSTRSWYHMRVICGRRRGQRQVVLVMLLVQQLTGLPHLYMSLQVHARCSSPLVIEHHTCHEQHAL